MQVRAGGQSRTAALGDGLPGGDSFADFSQKCVQMKVGRHHAQAMIHDHGVAVQRHLLSKHDNAVRRGQDGRPHAAAKINAGVKNVEGAAVVGAGVAIAGSDDGVGDGNLEQAVPARRVAELGIDGGQYFILFLPDFGRQQVAEFIGDGDESLFVAAGFDAQLLAERRPGAGAGTHQF